MTSISLRRADEKLDKCCEPEFLAEREKKRMGKGREGAKRKDYRERKKKCIY